MAKKIQRKTLSICYLAQFQAQQAPASRRVPGSPDDPHALAGNRTLGAELRGHHFDTILVPVFNGGLMTGIEAGIADPKVQIVGARSQVPDGFNRNDLPQSLIPETCHPAPVTSSFDTCHPKPDTQRHATLEVSHPMACDAVRELFLLANLKAEPTGALALAVLMANPEKFRDQSVCCIVTGANVDPHPYASILQS